MRKATFSLSRLLFLIVGFFLVSIGSLNAQYTVQLGSGTNYGGTTTAGPLNNYYESIHTQMIYSAAEITAAGASAGDVLEVGLNVYGVPSNALNGFTIKMKNTTAAVGSSYDGVGLTTVKTFVSYTPTLGWDMITLDTPFAWDGTSNLLVDMCYGPTSSYTSTGQVYTYGSYGDMKYYRTDGVNTCATSATSSGNKPQMKLTFSPLYDCDLKADSWDAPGLFSSDLTAAESVTVTVRNVGNVAQSGYNVAYSIDNGTTWVTETISATLPAASTYQHTFATTADFSLSGDYDCLFSVSLACDSNATNDQLAVTVNNASSVTSFPYFQNFESTQQWVAGGTASSWALGVPSASVINSAASPVNCWTTNLTGNYNSNEYSWVESPFFNLSSLTAPVIEFKMWYDIQTGFSDGAALQYSLDGGLTWQHVGIGIGALTTDPNGDNWYNTMSVEGLQYYNGWAGNTNGWETAKYFAYGTNAITNLAGQSSVKFRFLFGSNAYTSQNGFAFDDFSVYQNPDNDLRAMAVYTDPTCIGSTSLTNVYIDVKNEGALSQSAFSVSYSIDGGSTFITEAVTYTLAAGDVYTYTFATQTDMTTPGSYTVIGAVNLSGDQNNYNDTTYQSYDVLAGLPAEDFEGWGPTQSYNGSCDAGTLGATGGLWYQDQVGDNGEWRLDYGGTGSSSTGPSTDFNPGTSSGYYLYTEASGCYGTTVHLLSPCLDFSSSAYKLKFAYHMWGQTMGSLSVDVWDGTQWVNDVWTESGDHGDQWFQAEVGLGAFTNSDAVIRLRGVTGTSYYSDMAIDDVSLIELLPDDAAVIGMTPQSFCADTIDVYAIVENQGNNPIASLNVDWSINGVAQTGITISDTMATGAVDTLLLGSYYFASGIGYDINIWSSMPNGNVDPIPSSDTLVMLNFMTSLSGTYTIGDSTANFQGFVEAVDALINYGVCGPVVFVADSGTYEGQITLPPILGADSTNNITFTSATGDSTDVVVQASPASSSSNWVWSLGQDWVTINGITVKAVGSGNYGRVIVFNGTNHSTISNCVIQSKEVSSSYSSCFYNYSTTVDEYNTIMNNQILYGYYGIYFYSSSSNLESGNVIQGNNIQGYYYYGLYSRYQYGIHVIGNSLQQSLYGSSYSYNIYLYYTDGPIRVLKNRVFDDGGSSMYGIRIYYCDADASDPGIIANNFISCANTTSSTYGIYLYYSNNQKFLNNSVYLTSGSTTGSYGVYMYASSSNGSGYVFRNNSIVNTGGGYAVYLRDIIYTNTLLTSDHNNWYTSGANLGKITYTNIATLADWQNYYAGDSLSVNGSYASETDLHSNSPDLNNAGTPIPFITDDIDGDPRDPATPDIGADEFTPSSDDAGISAMPGLDAICPGVVDVYATIHNYGLVPIMTVNVNWSVDGVAQTPVAVSDSIPVGGDLDVYLGTFTFAQNVAYDVAAWTSSPNGIADPNTSNDLFEILGLQTAISGTYTIGATGDFTAIQDAADFISLYGICGAVVFNIESGVYDEEVTLGSIPGADSLNTVTFQSQTGNAADVTVQYAATSSTSDNWVWAFNGADWTTVQNMTIKSTTTGSYGRVVIFQGSSNHNQLLNNKIQSVEVSSSYAAGIRSYSDSKDEYNLIQGNEITGGYYGIYWYTSSSNTENGNQFIDNSVTNFYYYGIYNYRQYANVVSGNYISQSPTGSSYTYPTYIGYCDGPIQVTNNIIFDDGGSSCYGLRVYYCDASATERSLVANNWVSTINNTSSQYGLYIYYSTYVDVYHNSVYIVDAGSSSYGCYIYASSSNNYDFKNNSIVNLAGGYALYGSSNTISTMTSDHNNYYTTGSNFAYMSGYYATLADWQTIYPDDVVSSTGGYLAPDNLHSLSADLDGAGTPTYVTTDIDGEVRDAVTPDIGADEFQLFANNLNLRIVYTYGDIPVVNGANHVVSALVANWGTATQTNVPVTLNITGANTFTDVYTLASIAPGEQDTIYFNPFTPVAQGMDTVTVSVPADQDPSNDMASYNQVVGTNLFAYADDSPVAGAIGSSGSGMLLTKYYLDGLKAIGDVGVFIPDASSVGYVISGVVLDSLGNILSQTDPDSIMAGDVGTWKDLMVTDPSLTTMANTDFYVGIVMDYASAGSFAPVGVQEENPTRLGAYYTDDLGGGNLETTSALGRLMIRATTTDPAAWDAVAVAMLSPNGGCGLGVEDIVFQIQNYGADTITTFDASYQVVGGAAVTETVNATILPGTTYDYTFSAQYDFSVLADSTFGISLWVDLVGDNLNANDSIYTEFESMFVPDDPVPYGTTVVFGTSGTVSCTSPYNVLWFDNPVGGLNFIAMGDTFYNTPVLFDTTSYWVQATTSSEGDFTYGTGASSYSTTSCNPYGQYYTSNANQHLILASDLQALGMVAGGMNSLSLYVNSYTGQALQNFEIKVGATTLSSLTSSSWQTTGMQSVYTNASYMPVSGWNLHEFTTPFQWDGVSNIVIEFCFTNGTSNWTSNANIAGDYLAYTSGIGYYTDGSFTCGNPGTSYIYTTSFMPQMQINAGVPGCFSNMVEVVANVTNIPDWDAGISNIVSPVSGVELGTQNICVDIQNLGQNTIQNFPIVYEINNGATLVTELVTTPILPGDVINFCFQTPYDFTTFGNYDLCVYTQLPNDGYSTNDSMCVVITNDPLTYCVSTATSTGYEEIIEVGIGSFVNNSGPAFGSMYQDFTSLTPLSVSPGMSYPIYVTSDFPPGYSYPYTTYIEVYIDWNHDGVFDETTDELAFSSLSTSSNTASGIVTVPVTALSGTHGMRVVFQETSSGTYVHPCGTYTWGETEDYMITVVPPEPYDAGATAILAPSQTATLVENDMSGVDVIVYNLGLNDITSMDVSYTIDGGTPVVFNWTGLLSSFESDTVNFPAIALPGGYFDLCAYTTFTNDTNPINDTVCASYYALPQYDLEMNTLVAPISGCDMGMEPVTVEFTVLGDTITDGITLGYFNNAMATPVTETYTDTLYTGVTYTYTFTTPVDLAVITDTDFDFTAFLSYTPDPVLSNDTVYAVVTSGVSPAAPSANNVTIWSSEMATLQVNNPDTTMVYAWYGPDTVQVSSDTMYTTTQLFDTTTYFLTAANGQGASLAITNTSIGGPDFIEITNMSNSPVDATGWVVAVSNSYTNINSINSVYWYLGQFQGNEIQYKTDSSSDNYWGSNILWNPGSPSSYRGWAVIIDDNGNIVDFWAHGWQAADFANFTGIINGFAVDFTTGWSGDGIQTATMDYFERVIYDTDEATDWINTSINTMGQPYSGLTNQGGSGAGCESPLVPVTVFVQYADYDGGVVETLAPQSGLWLSTEDVTATFYNNGLNALSNFDVYYTVDGGTPVVETIAGPLAPGDSLTYTFNAGALLSAYTTYTICVGITVANDGYAPNNELCFNVTNFEYDGLTCSSALPYTVINDPPVTGNTGFAYGFKWWKFDVPVAYENVIVSLCGSSYDTYLQVYSSCGGAPIYSNDDYCGVQSQINMAGIVQPGTYYVKVYGYSSAFGDYILTITGDQVPLFTVNTVVTDVTCSGAATGIISTSIAQGPGGTTGTSPYTYLWSDGSTGSDLLNAMAGTYQVTVTDATGWTETAEATITEPTAVVVSGAVTDVSTLGGNDGAIDLTVSGGVSPYTYAWNNGDTIEDPTALYAGYYTVTVTDANGCDMVENYTVNSPVPAGWAVTPTLASHNIVVPSNALITLDGVGLNPGSFIGVFYDSLGTLVCGGWAYWSGFDATVVAYGTDPGMNNGFAPNEVFKWKVYDAGLNVQYAGSATYNTTFYPNDENFVIGGLSGITELTAFSIITQNINLPAGWSIWSTYIDPIDPLISSVMADIVAPPFTPGPTEIVKSGAGLIYWPFYNLNTIGNIVIGEGYQVKINGTSSVTFGVTGLQIQPEVTPFTIPNGWSIIGYLRTTAADISVMLAPLTMPPFTPGGNLEIAKNGAGLIYWPFYGLNTIGNMIPGEGYQVKLNLGPTSFTYPANTSVGTKTAEVNVQMPQNYIDVKPSGDNMTIGIPADAWNVEPMIGDEIAAFGADGKLIGSVVFQGGFTALTVWGDEIIDNANQKGSNGQLVTLKLWHAATTIEEDIVVNAWTRGSDEYVSDGISVVGKLTLSGEFGDQFVLGQNMPNPFNNTTRIPFYIPEDCHVSIAIYNTLGEFVTEIMNKELSAGQHEVTFDASDLAAGNYYYKLISDKYTTTRSMSIK